VVALREKAVRVSALTGTTDTIVVTGAVVDPCRLAVRVTWAVVLVFPPTRLNARLAAPAGTVTLAGTANAVELLLESCTACPPAGAGMLRDTLHTSVFPTVTLACWQRIPARLIEGTI
jgi:choline dehydrogenase-like flavoprotein